MHNETSWKSMFVSHPKHTPGVFHWKRGGESLLLNIWFFACFDDISVFHLLSLRPWNKIVPPYIVQKSKKPFIKWFQVFSTRKPGFDIRLSFPIWWCNIARNRNVLHVHSIQSGVKKICEPMVLAVIYNNFCMGSLFFCIDCR